MISVLKLVNAEMILLEIEAKYKFELAFNEMFTLHKYLNEVGEITNYFFNIQNEYYDIIKDKEKLELFHDRLVKDEVEYDYHNLLHFIIDIAEKLNKNDINKLLEEYKLK